MRRPAVSSRAGLLLLLFALLAGCGERPADPPAPTAASDAAAPDIAPLVQAPPALHGRIHVQPVTQRPIPETITAPGEVALDLKQVAKITSRIAGQVERIHAQLGDHVKVGQPLVVIGSLQFDQLIEEYLVGKAQVDVAENSFHRSEKLRAAEVVTEQRLIQDKGRYLETSARFQHVREKLLNMGLTPTELTQIERGRHDKGHQFTLNAPIAGTVVAQQAVRGQGLAAGDELFEIVDTGRVWIFANLPIEQARRVREGDQGAITPKGGEPVTAPVTYLAPVADETTRTIRVRLEADNRQGQLKPHEYVDVRFTWSGGPAPAVPISALTTVNRVTGLFLSQAGGYRFTPVETGRQNDDWIEIRRGVQVGDQVVVDGVFDLKNLLLKEQIGSGG